MKTLIMRTLTGIAYLSILALAFFVSKYALLMVFTFFLLMGVIEYIRLVQKFPVPKSNMQRIMQRQILPVVWIIFPIILLEYWCIRWNATNIMVALFIILCMNDTLAYIFGSLLGKHKMAPKISPKKSWEGFFGGLICTIAFTYFIMHISYFQNDTFTKPYIWMGFAFVVIIAGTLGDLAESKLKRFAQQKDSGSILPGHGGMLDRLDSMLFAVPVGFIYWEIAGMYI